MDLLCQVTAGSNPINPQDSKWGTLLLLFFFFFYFFLQLHTPSLSSLSPVCYFKEAFSLRLYSGDYAPFVSAEISQGRLLLWQLINATWLKVQFLSTKGEKWAHAMFTFWMGFFHYKLHCVIESIILAARFIFCRRNVEKANYGGGGMLIVIVL